MLSSLSFNNTKHLCKILNLFFKGDHMDLEIMDLRLFRVFYPIKVDKNINLYQGADKEQSW